jgi:hypothetical protein
VLVRAVDFRYNPASTLILEGVMRNDRRLAILLLLVAVSMAALATGPAGAITPCTQCALTNDCYSCCQCDGLPTYTCANLCFQVYERPGQSASAWNGIAGKSVSACSTADRAESPRHPKLDLSSVLSARASR